MSSLEISSAQFRVLSEQITAIASEYLNSLDSVRIVPEASGEAIEKAFAANLPEEGLGEAALDELRDVVRHSRAQNGRFLGYVLGSGEPAGATTELLCSVLNQNVTAWRSAPAAVTLEKLVVRWLAEAVGCGGFTGVLCGGGSAANLMGLAMAREEKVNSNGVGLRACGELAIYASEEVHMSIPKAIALLGIGQNNLRRIPVDGNFRMIPAQLEREMKRDVARDVTPVAVIGSAGTVKTGAVDPLSAVAEIATNYGAWFHVDGAYGALAAIAERAVFHGMDRADSLSLDAHKWLYQPIDCGCLLHRHAATAQQAFSNSGDYVRVLGSGAIEGFSFFDETIELSRRFRALKIWFSLRYHGLTAFREAIRKDLRLARRLGELIEGNPQLELLAPIELSAVCFRYVGNGRSSETHLDDLNAEVLKRVIARGRIYLSNATVQSRFGLRACLVNHRTSEADIDEVVNEVLSVAGEVASGA